METAMALVVYVYESTRFCIFLSERSFFFWQKESGLHKNVKIKSKRNILKLIICIPRLVSQRSEHTPTSIVK